MRLHKFIQAFEICPDVFDLQAPQVCKLVPIENAEYVGWEESVWHVYVLDYHELLNVSHADFRVVVVWDRYAQAEI